jgi:hypothetical protein
MMTQGILGMVAGRRGVTLLLAAAAIVLLDAAGTDSGDLPQDCFSKTHLCIPQLPFNSH